MIKVVVLVITVSNPWTGEKLLEKTRVFDDPINPSVNRIEACRRSAVLEAYDLTEEYKKTNSWASTNVNCHWEQRPGAPA